MIICSCAVISTAQPPEHCAIRTFLEKTNTSRARQGQAPLTARSPPAELQGALRQFYAEHRPCKAHPPCRRCAPALKKALLNVLNHAAEDTGSTHHPSS